jgi:hypothetical protein
VARVDELDMRWDGTEEGAKTVARQVEEMLVRRCKAGYSAWPDFSVSVVLNDYARLRVRKADMLQWLSDQAWGDDASKFEYVSGELRFNFKRREYVFQDKPLRFMVTVEVSLYRALMLEGIGRSEQARLLRALWRGGVSQEVRDAIKKELQKGEDV